MNSTYGPVSHPVRKAKRCVSMDQTKAAPPYNDTPPFQLYRTGVYKLVDFLIRDIARAVVIEGLHDGLKIFRVDELERPVI